MTVYHPPGSPLPPWQKTRLVLLGVGAILFWGGVFLLLFPPSHPLGWLGVLFGGGLLLVGGLLHEPPTAFASLLPKRPAPLRLLKFAAPRLFSKPAAPARLLPEQPFPQRLRLLAFAWVLLAAALPLIGVRWHLRSVWGLVLWFAALIAATVAFAPWKAPRPGRGLWLVALGLFLLTLATHLPYLNQQPLLSSDEGSFGLTALEFIRGFRNNPFAIGWYSFPAMFSLWEVPGILLWGRTAFALRALAVLGGALTVIGLYVLGWKLFTRRVGLVAALLLIGHHAFTHFSRLALNNVWDAVSFSWVSFLLWKAWHEDDHRAWFLLAFVLGFAQYFYVSSRLLLAWAAGWLLLWAWRDRAWRRLMRRLPAALTLFVVITAPLIMDYVNTPAHLWAAVDRAKLWGPRLQEVMGRTHLSAWQVVLLYIARSIGGVFWVPTRGWYLPGVPMLRPVWSAFWFFGLGWLLWRWWERRTWYLLSWLLAVLISAGPTETVPAAQRYVVLYPLLALITAVGVVQLVSIFSVDASREVARRSVVTALAVVLALGLAASDLHFYYFRYLPPHPGDPNTIIANDVAERLLSLRPQPALAFFGGKRMGYFSIRALPFRVPDLRAKDFDAQWTPEQIHEALGEGPIFFAVLPEQTAVQPGLARAFPHGQWRAVPNPLTREHEPLYWYYLYQP